MKVAFIITSVDTGGAETTLLNVLEHIDRQRFSPHVISLTTLGEIGLRIQALGIPVEALGMKVGLPSSFAVLRLVRRLRAIRPDLVHTTMYHANLLGGMAARLAGIAALSRFTMRQANKRGTLAVVAAGAILSRWMPGNILICSEGCTAGACEPWLFGREDNGSRMVLIFPAFSLMLWREWRCGANWGWRRYPAGWADRSL